MKKIKKKNLSFYIGLITILILVFFGLVYFFNKNNEENKSIKNNTDNNLITISTGTQATFGDLKIGVSYIHTSNYNDDKGLKKHGSVAGLRLFFRGDSSKDQRLQVYTGKNFKIDRYDIFVEKISSGITSGSIRLRIKETKDKELENSDLLFAVYTGSGLCRNEQGEEGGCYSNTYLYLSGKFIKRFTWVGINERTDKPSVEKQLSKDSMNQITKKIRDSNILVKNCPPQKIIDASWSYYLNLDGIKKEYKESPSGECLEDLNKITALINSLAEINK